MNIDFKIGNRRTRSFDEEEMKMMRHNTSLWIGLATVAVGAGSAIYGANQQKKANQAAVSANQANADQTNQSAWNSYLLSRGVNPAGAATGTIPTNGQAVNTKLPLWANVSRPSGAAKGFRLTASGIGGPRLALGSNFNQPAPVVDPNAVAAGAGGGGAGGNNIKDILIGNPLGIGGKDRSWYDPLGIF